MLKLSRIAGIAPALAAIAIVELAAGATAGRDELVTVNGQNLHVQTLGTSGPTIVFEAGLGNDLSTWKFVADPVAAFARVVAYDRAGLGRSLPWSTRIPP